MFSTALRGTAVALLLLYLCWNSLYYLPFTVDDAFISFRYARNLADGHGLVYNPGELVEGYSNLSWVLISALMLALGLPLLTAMKIFGLACGLAIAAVVWVLTRRFAEDERGREWGALLALAVVCTHTGIAVWTQAGLETVLYALLLTAAVWRFEEELRHRGRFPWSAVLVGAMAMTRPETPIYVLYFAGRLAVRAIRPEGRKAALRWFGIVLPILAIYELWGQWYYGELLPNTFHAKIGGGPEGSPLEPLLASGYVGRFVMRQGWGWLVLLGLAVAGPVLARDRRSLGLYLPILCGVAFAIYARGDWMPRHRLLIPVLPLVTVATGSGFVQVWRWIGPRPLLAIPVAVLAVASLGDHFVRQAFAQDPTQEHTKNNYGRVARGNWFAEVPDRLRERKYPSEQLAIEIVTSVPENEYVAIRDIGFPGYFSNNPIWDVFGLVTSASATARHDPSEEAQRATLEDLMSRNPGLILLRLGREGSWMRELHAMLESDPRIVNGYEADTVGPRNPRAATHVAVYRRRDIPAFDPEERLARAIDRLGGAPLTRRLEDVLAGGDGQLRQGR